MSTTSTQNPKKPHGKSGPNYPSNKAVIDYVNKNTGIPVRDCRDIIRGALHFIADELEAGRSVNLHSFGRFNVKKRKGRITQFTNHPVLGTRTVVKEDSRYVRFIASRIVRQKLNPPKA